MRVLIACLLLVSMGLPLAQSSRDLRSRFGEPDVERYSATNDIGLTVEYGSDGLACQIVIERKQALLHGNQEQQYMLPEAVSALIDEIVPPASRGHHINTLLESMGCAERRVDEYENVWIGRYTDMCIPLRTGFSVIFRTCFAISSRAIRGSPFHSALKSRSRDSTNRRVSRICNLAVPGADACRRSRRELSWYSSLANGAHH
jgi:hypothetical protein